MSRRSPCSSKAAWYWQGRPVQPSSSARAASLGRSVRSPSRFSSLFHDNWQVPVGGSDPGIGKELLDVVDAVVIGERRDLTGVERHTLEPLRAARSIVSGNDSPLMPMAPGAAW